MNKKMKQALAAAALATFATTIAPTAALADGGATAPQNPPVTAPAATNSTTASLYGAVTNDAEAVAAGLEGGANGSVTANLYGTTADPTASLPSVSVTPDSLFYSVKIFFEKLDLFFTLTTTNKAQALLDQAQVRLAEAKAAVAAGNQEAASQAMERYNATMSEAARLTKQAAEAHKDITKLETKVETTKPAWAQVLAELIAATPEADRQQLVEKVAPALLEMVKVETAGKKETKPDAAKPETEAQPQTQQESDEQQPLDQQALEKLAADQAALALQMQAAGVKPQTLLVLIQLAEHSHKPLAQVYALYLQNPGIGHLAGILGVSVKDAVKGAHADLKAKNTVVQIQAAPVAPQTEAQSVAPAAAVQLQAPLVIQGKVASVHHEDEDDDDDEHEHKDKHENDHGKEKSEHGNGHGKGKHD